MMSFQSNCLTISEHVFSCFRQPAVVPTSEIGFTYSNAVPFLLVNSFCTYLNESHNSSRNQGLYSRKLSQITN